MIAVRPHRIPRSVITIAIGAIACSVGAPDAESNRDSPLPTPTQIVVEPSDTPTAIPTPTPTSTPTPPPAVRLTDAVRALHNGNYGAAVEEYQSVLAGSGSADELETAHFGLGEAKLRQGDPFAAETELMRFISLYPDSSRLADAWFLLAEARYASGNFTGAADAYRAYLDLRGDVIESYVQERIGDALNRAGDTNASVEAYRQAIASAPNTSIAAGQREKLALIYRLSGNFDDAIEQYRAILSFAQIDSYRAHVMQLLGQTLIDSGDTDGYDVFLDLVNAYPRTNEAYDALVSLVNNGVAVNPFQRGLIDYHAGQYDAAVAALSVYIDTIADHDDAHYYLAMSYRAAGNTRAAIRQFDTLIEDHAESQFWGQAWIDKAVAQSLGGDLDGAIGTLTAFAKDNPRAALAPNALLRAGLLLERAAEYERAAEMYRLAQESYPYGTSAPNALFAAGLNAYRANETDMAIEAWRVLSDTYPAADLYPAALLWQGKLAQNAGDAQARTLLELGAQASPNSYYGIRAAELRDNRPTLQSIPLSLELDEVADRAEAEAWLETWARVDDVSVLGVLPSPILEDGRMQRGAELWRLGWVDRAKGEFEGVREAYKDDPAALYALSLYWRDIGLYRSSLLAAARLIATSPDKTAERAPAFVARLAYPIYYSDLVVPQAEAYGLDPLLMFALIRQESLFEGIAVSSAFANGLMQIIPGTGREIASALGWPNYDTNELYKPYVSVAFGTYYLARQRDFLDGDLYAALAAYNGGPGNSLRWQERANGDPDLFLETITLNETRTYLLRIREHLAMYQKLYGASE